MSTGTIMTEYNRVPKQIARTSWNKASGASWFSSANNFIVNDNVGRNQNTADFKHQIPVDGGRIKLIFSISPIKINPLTSPSTGINTVPAAAISPGQLEYTVNGSDWVSLANKGLGSSIEPGWAYQFDIPDAITTASDYNVRYTGPGSIWLQYAEIFP